MLLDGDLKIPLKVSLHAHALLAQEKRGYIDSIVLPDNFTGEFYSFSDLKEPKNISICNQDYPLFDRKVYFKGQPIGLFINHDPYLISTYEASTQVYYSQDEIFFPKQDYKTTRMQSTCVVTQELMNNKSSLLEKKTTLSPPSEKQDNKKRITVIFEYHEENSTTLWVPCNLSTWLKESIEKAFPCEIYGRINLRSLCSSPNEINLSLLFIFICQLLYVGFKVKRNILLHSDLFLLRNVSQPSVFLSSFHQPEESSSPLFYQLSLFLPFSLRWYNTIFKKLIKDILRANLAPNKFSIILSEPHYCPLFYSSFEDILKPLSELIYQHIETNLKDPHLMCYYKDYKYPTQRKLLLNLLLKKSDFLRKNYSYSRQEAFLDQKLFFPTKKGIGLCFFDTGLELNDCKINLYKDTQKKIIYVQCPYFPLHSATFSLFQERLADTFSWEKDYKLQVDWEKTYDLEPNFHEAWDWLLDASSHNLLGSTMLEDLLDQESLTFGTNLKSQPIACVVELKGEIWIHEIEIVNIYVIMQKGRKDHKDLEQERVLSIIECFLSTELPKHLKIINDWSSRISLHILKEGTGSFINLPYALRSAFFSALQQNESLNRY